MKIFTYIYRCICIYFKKWKYKKKHHRDHGFDFDNEFINISFSKLPDFSSLIVIRATVHNHHDFNIAAHSIEIIEPRGSLISTQLRSAHKDIPSRRKILLKDITIIPMHEIRKKLHTEQTAIEQDIKQNSKNNDNNDDTINNTTFDEKDDIIRDISLFLCIKLSPKVIRNFLEEIKIKITLSETGTFWPKRSSKTYVLHDFHLFEEGKKTLNDNDLEPSHDSSKTVDQGD